MADTATGGIFQGLLAGQQAARQKAEDVFRRHQEEWQQKYEAAYLESQKKSQELRDREAQEKARHDQEMERLGFDALQGKISHWGDLLEMAGKKLDQAKELYDKGQDVKREGNVLRAYTLQLPQGVLPQDAANAISALTGRPAPDLSNVPTPPVPQSVAARNQGTAENQQAQAALTKVRQDTEEETRQAAASLNRERARKAGIDADIAEATKPAVIEKALLNVKEQKVRISLLHSQVNEANARAVEIGRQTQKLQVETQDLSEKLKSIRAHGGEAEYQRYIKENAASHEKDLTNATKIRAQAETRWATAAKALANYVKTQRQSFAMQDDPDPKVQQAGRDLSAAATKEAVAIRQAEKGAREDFDKADARVKQLEAIQDKNTKVTGSGGAPDSKATKALHNRADKTLKGGLPGMPGTRSPFENSEHDKSRMGKAMTPDRKTIKVKAKYRFDPKTGGLVPN